MNIKAIFFDLDDTLHDHHAPFARAIIPLITSSESQLNTVDMYKTFRYYSDVLWKEYDGGEIPLDQLRIERIVRTLKDYEVEVSNEKAIRFQQSYENELNTLTLFPEVPMLIKELKKVGVEVGLITNGPIQHQRMKIQQLGLDEYFLENHIFISDQVGKAKPDPYIFEVAAREIKLPSENLLYVGDSWENDVVGPMKAGWNAVWFNHRGKHPLTDHKPIAEINTLSTLLALVKYDN
ncbi:HAD family hydrolase [Mesobacillus maritimus]|uniref:HAD family hydrolase n=1 Tax=Mesobacillus maritimus TaxID=1643336 RepID=A0ABS7K8M2_9BACI|nr:HAD family hydrolase [Mesobacillus maritimus]MBY0098614.1 HAD family hydrolase [Mesobacillus maritimus]